MHNIRKKSKRADASLTWQSENEIAQARGMHCQLSTPQLSMGQNFLNSGLVCTLKGKLQEHQHKRSFESEKQVTSITVKDNNKKTGWPWFYSIAVSIAIQHLWGAQMKASQMNRLHHNTTDILSAEIPFTSATDWLDSLLAHTLTSTGNGRGSSSDINTKPPMKFCPQEQREQRQDMDDQAYWHVQY